MDLAKLDELSKDPPRNWIRSVSAICCYEDSVFIGDGSLCRVSVWSATTLHPVRSFGQPSTLASVDCLCVYRSDASTPPVLVINGGVMPYLLVYTLDGHYLGAQYSDLRECTSLSFDCANSDLWAVGEWEGANSLDEFRVRLKVGQWVDFRHSDRRWYRGKVVRIAKPWFPFRNTQVWLEHTVAGKVAVIKAPAKDMWPAGMRCHEWIRPSPAEAAATSALSGPCLRF